MNKNEARKIVLDCAKKYERNLNNKQYLVLYRDREFAQLQCLELSFSADNYMHLTGLQMIDKNGHELKNMAESFYNKCLTQKLSNEEIRMKDSYTTGLKLQALPILTDFQKITKIAGDYNRSRTYLIVDKFIGNVNFCLGIKQIPNGFYVPASAINENIKKLTTNPSQVLALLCKPKTETIYAT